MSIHTNSKRVPSALNLGSYQKSKGCTDCDNDVWYVMDERGLKWHKDLRLCSGSRALECELRRERHTGVVEDEG